MDQRGLVERAQRGDHDAFAALVGEGGSRIIGRPSLSPDGTTLAYGAWHPSEGRVAMHILDNESGRDREPFRGCGRHTLSSTTAVAVLDRHEGGATVDQRGLIEPVAGTATLTDLASTSGVSWQRRAS
ncbi:hypothetical protein BH20CHL7_BH20CHL7_00900 [soil metagenome]